MPSLDALKFANEQSPPSTGLYRITERVIDVVSSGVTGTLFTSPVIAENQIIKITSLLTDDNNPQGGITLVADGVTLIDNAQLGDQSPTLGNFGVSSQAINIGGNIISEVYCKSFTFSKSGGLTTLPIKYVYEILEPIE